MKYRVYGNYIQNFSVLVEAANGREAKELASKFMENNMEDEDGNEHPQREAMEDTYRLDQSDMCTVISDACEEPGLF